MYLLEKCTWQKRIQPSSIQQSQVFSQHSRCISHCHAQICHFLSCWSSLPDILLLQDPIMQHCSCPPDQCRMFWMWEQPPPLHQNRQHPTRRRTCEGRDGSREPQIVGVCCNWPAADPGMGPMDSLGERCTLGGTVLPQSSSGLRKK